MALLLGAALWLGSTRFELDWFDGGQPLHGFAIAGGRVIVASYFGSTAPRGWSFDPCEEMNWGPTLLRVPQEHAVFIPLWWPLPPLAVITTILWMREATHRRRATTHLCKRCRYDRSGLASAATCPECGAVPKPILSAPT